MYSSFQAELENQYITIPLYCQPVNLREIGFESRIQNSGGKAGRKVHKEGESGREMEWGEGGRAVWE
jgi:hypothetical protein